MEVDTDAPAGDTVQDDAQEDVQAQQEAALGENMHLRPGDERTHDVTNQGSEDEFDDSSDEGSGNESGREDAQASLRGRNEDAEVVLEVLPWDKPGLSRAQKLKAIRNYKSSVNTGFKKSCLR